MGLRPKGVAWWEIGWPSIWGSGWGESSVGNLGRARYGAWNQEEWLDTREELVSELGYNLGSRLGVGVGQRARGKTWI